MTIDLSGSEALTRRAVAHYWKTLDVQSKRQKKGDADRGGRAAVTGGKQMNGFCALVRETLLKNGLNEADIYIQNKLELPGYFRPTKEWDMLIVRNRTLLAALEFKSQKGPSFGNNFNNRSEEAIGTGSDLATAYREGVLGPAHPRPWVGWVMLLEDCDRSNSVVSVAEPHFSVFPEFKEASYSQRYEWLLRKLVREKLYDSAAFLTAKRTAARTGDYMEPANDLTMKRFLAGLTGHVAACLAESE